MKKYILFIICLIVVPATQANGKDFEKTDASIIGHVIDKRTGEHLPYVAIGLRGTTIGTTTDATGHYFLKNLPEGKFTIVVKYIGYENQEYDVEIKKGDTQEVNFELQESNISLDEVVISSSRTETPRRIAPSLVNVLDMKVFERTNSTTVIEGLSFQPGLRIENNCQNCGLTQVRMNGLDGAYSQILVDSRPIFSSLAAVYGLEQIPANMVERVEVVRGGGSALFGASAIAGTINIITKEPIRNSAQLSHNIMSIGGSSSFDNNTSMNASLVSDDHKMGLMLFGQKRDRSAYDHDGDGFSEIPQLNSNTLGFRSFIRSSTYSRITFEYHNMNEFRRGGDNLHKEPFNAYIAEQVATNIDAGSLKYDIFSPNEKQKISLYSAAQLVKRKSYYGGGEPIKELVGNESDEEIANYNNRLNAYGKTKGATYSIGGMYAYELDHLLFMPAGLTTGVEYMYDNISDRSGYRSESVDQSVNMKSIYAQNEWKNKMWSFLVGGRLDKHNMLNNPVVSPRTNIRYNPVQDINIRVSYGQGFRAPQLFDEDLHVDIAGGEYIVSVRDLDLKEEKSHSFSSSVDWYKQIGSTELNFLLEGFYTNLNNPFASVSEEQVDGSIVKTIVNASGAKVYGITIENRMAYSDLLQLQLGFTIQQSLYNEARKWSGNDNDDTKPERKMMRTPNAYGFFVATLTPFKSFSSSFSGTYTGSMLIPHEAGFIEKNRTDKSSSFFDLNWRIAYEIPLYKGTDIEFNAGVQNIFNAYQKDFDKGKDRASAYVYGPMLPRSYFAGVKLCF